MRQFVRSAALLAAAAAFTAGAALLAIAEDNP